MAQLPHDFRKSWDIVDVLDALAHRLQDDGEGRILAGNVQKLLGTLALLPQRRALAGIAPRQKQRAGRTFAEAGGKERGIAHLLGHDIGNLIGVEGKDGSIGLGFGLRQAQHDAVVTSYCLRIHAGALAYPGPHC